MNEISDNSSDSDSDIPILMPTYQLFEINYFKDLSWLISRKYQPKESHVPLRVTFAKFEFILLDVKEFLVSLSEVQVDSSTLQVILTNCFNLTSLRISDITNYFDSGDPLLNNYKPFPALDSKLISAYPAIKRVEFIEGIRVDSLFLESLACFLNVEVMIIRDFSRNDFSITCEMLDQLVHSCDKLTYLSIEMLAFSLKLKLEKCEFIRIFISQNKPIPWYSFVKFGLYL
jgi:hypothetical protein